MRIRWTPAAAADLQGISDYLKDHGVEAGAPMPNVAVYRVGDEAIGVLRIYHECCSIRYFRSARRQRHLKIEFPQHQFHYVRSGTRVTEPRR